MKRLSYLLLFIICFSFVFVSCKKESPVTPAGTQTATIKVEDVVLYELFVRNFTPEGTFNAIIPRLQELKDLGVNTIWLMPIHPIGEVNRKGELGSPYSVKDYYEVNPSMGSKEDFRNLVNAIHDKGMPVILDWVANHTAWDNAWITAHKDWYTQDSHGNIIPPTPDWTDVADLNYNNADMRNEMIKAMSYWVKEYNIDGFRCDAAEMVPNDFWAAAISAVKKIKPVFMLAEGENKLLFSQGFNVCFSWTGYSDIKSIFSASNTSLLTYDVNTDLSLLPSGAYRMRYTTNHDETSWDKTPPELFGGIPGAKAASVITISLKGIPMIYNGQEVGSTIHQNLFVKTNIDWGNTSGMRDFYKKLFSVYNSNPELRYGSYGIIDISNNIVAISRTYNNSKMIVITNVRNNQVTASMPAEYVNKRFTNVITNDTITFQSNISLNAYEYMILKQL
ncbi:MAG: alpha-amylase family glycosyl hydrolase [Bacteroidota bacterium]|nr:alpha-amylase family glycosyl hydrolase [Bacteroidota bacterium]